MPNTVIINTDRLPATIAGSINGPMRFPSFVKVGKNSKDTELKSVWLRVGPNHGVSDEDLEYLGQNAIAQGFIESGVIEIVRPIPSEGELTGLSKEYTPADIRRVVATTDDMDWLQESMLTEPRPDIKAALKSRLQLLTQEYETAMARAGQGGGNASN